jgi:GT2 family glycosyltransferase
VAALEAQTVAVEVVVVEDVEGRGPAWARNEGVRRASGEVVCFTDDDCAPAVGWAEALAAPILNGAAQATAGRTWMGGGATAADRAWEAIVSYLQDQATKPGTSSPGFAATANLACARELLKRMPFDESFTAAAGEDRDWSERAAREGAAPLLVPGAIVFHQAGMDARTFLRQQYRYGQGAARFRSVGQSRGFGSLSFYLGLLHSGFVSGPVVGILICVSQATIIAGVVSRRR